MAYNIALKESNEGFPPIFLQTIYNIKTLKILRRINMLAEEVEYLWKHIFWLTSTLSFAEFFFALVFFKVQQKYFQGPKSEMKQNRVYIR